MLADIIVKVAGMEIEERGDYRPRPSLAGPQRCIRQMVYWAKKTAPDRQMGDRFAMTIDDSTFHEYLTSDWISKSSFKIHSSQMPLDIIELDFMPKGTTHYCKHCDKQVPDNILHGHPDGIVTDLLGVDHHYEHKAVNRFAFDRYWKGEFPLDYITQCCLCIVGLNKELHDKITTSVLLLKCKDTAQYMEFIIKYDETEDRADIMEANHSNGERRFMTDGSPLLTIEHIVYDAIKKFAAVDHCVKEGELPDRPFEMGTQFPCGYCAWEDTCWDGYLKEVEKLSENEADLTELEDSARFYKELGAQISDMETQKDEVAKRIKNTLKDMEARKGKAGEYFINWKVSEQTRMKSKDEIPEELLPKLMKTIIVETLSITKPKPKKGKKS
jgi:hypothetical protein